MPVANFADCMAAAKIAVREFNARWNMNALQIKPVPVRYLFTTEELASLEAAPRWYSAVEAFEALRGPVTDPTDLTRAGRQLSLLYARVERSPGPRSYYWVAPNGEEPTATDRARLLARR